MSDVNLLIKRISHLWKRRLERLDHQNIILARLSTITEYASTLAHVLEQDGLFSCSYLTSQQRLLLAEDMITQQQEALHPEFRLLARYLEPLQNAAPQQTWKLAQLSATVILPGDRPPRQLEELNPGWWLRIRETVRSVLGRSAVHPICSILGLWQMGPCPFSRGAVTKCLLEGENANVLVTYHDPVEHARFESFHDFWLARAATLSIDEKFQLAVNTARRLLCLSGSSWLTSQWTSRDMWVCQRGAGLGGCDLDVYLALTQGCDDPSHSYSHGGAEEAMESFGFMLMEIAEGRSWPEIRRTYAPEMSGDTDQSRNSNLEVIQRLLEHNTRNALQRMGPAFIEVVKKCITGLAEFTDDFPADGIFRGAVYEKVVCGLEDARDDYEFTSKWKSAPTCLLLSLFDDEEIPDGP